MTEEHHSTGSGGPGASARRWPVLEWGAATVVAALMVAIFFWPARAPVPAPGARLPVAKPEVASKAKGSELVIAESLRAKEGAVRATVKLAEILDRDPDNHEAHVELAYRMKELGFPDRAESEFSKALELRPDGAAWIGLGLLALERGDGEEAVTAFSEAVKLDPSSGEAKRQLGAAYRSAGRFDEAIALLEQAYQAEPASSETLYQLALAYSESGRTAEATASLQDLLRKEPSHEAAGQLLETLAP